jgi:hypothetical protein
MSFLPNEEVIAKKAQEIILYPILLSLKEHHDKLASRLDKIEAKLSKQKI